MTGTAQGRTSVCEKHCVAHEMCSCCWTHGVWNEASALTRQSITIRCYDEEWGRDVETCLLTAVEVVEVADGDEAAEDAEE